MAGAGRPRYGRAMPVRATALAIAALTYANAALTYLILTREESATLGGAVWKVVVSLPWLIAFATPLAVVFGLVGGWAVRRVHAALAPSPAALPLALAAFLLPASLLTEAALAWRDGWDWARWGIALAGGAAIAMLGAPLLRWTVPRP